MKKSIFPLDAAGAVVFLTFFLSGCAAQTGETEIKAPADAATMQQAQQALPASIPAEQRKKIEDSMRNSRSGAPAAAPAAK